MNTAQNGTFFNLDEFPGYRVDLRAGGVVIAQDSNSLVIAEAEWATSTVSIVVGAMHSQLGQNLGIRLVNLNIIPDGFTQATSPDLEVDFDNVALSTTAVPAPSPALLTGIAVNETGDEAVITWETDPGSTYDLLRTTDLATGFANTISGPYVAGATSLAVTDDVTGVESAYYQVRQP